MSPNQLIVTLLICGGLVQILYTYSEALRWCTQLTLAVGYIHNQHPLIIHRDLRLDNILLTGGLCPTQHFPLALSMEYIFGCCQWNTSVHKLTLSWVERHVRSPWGVP